METTEYRLFMKQIRNRPMCGDEGTSVINFWLPKINQKFKNTFKMYLVATNNDSS